MTEIVDHATWLTARRQILEKEKALTKARDALSAARRTMPVVKILAPYEFDSESGRFSLSELLGRRSQLIMYHFMFGSDAAVGCKMCSYWADNFNGISEHLAARDTELAVSSTAPLNKLNNYRQGMGWTFRWVSTMGSTFNRDFGVSFPGGVYNTGYNYTGQPAGPEMPGLSVFCRLQDGSVGHTYSTFSRGLDVFNVAYQMLDLTPLGRGEDDLQFSMSWVRRRDEYGDAADV